MNSSSGSGSLSSSSSAASSSSSAASSSSSALSSSSSAVLELLGLVGAVFGLVGTVLGRRGDVVSQAGGIGPVGFFAVVAHLIGLSGFRVRLSCVRRRGIQLGLGHDCSLSFLKPSPSGVTISSRSAVWLPAGGRRSVRAG
jgi:hypothetical protein